MTRRPDPADAHAALVLVLIAVRQRMQLTQRDLATRIGVAQSTVALWETPGPARRIPDAVTQHAWVQSLGLRLTLAVDEGACGDSPDTTDPPANSDGPKLARF